MTSREDIKAVTLLSSIDFAGRSVGFFFFGRGLMMGIEAKRSPAKLVLNLLPRIRILSNGPNFLKEAFTHNRNSKNSAAADQVCKSGQTQGVRMSDHSMTLAAR